MDYRLFLFCSFIWSCVGAKQRIINDDIDEFLGTVNEAVQLYGLNYVHSPGGVFLPDAKFEDIYVGELTTWKRVSDATITGEGLQSFSVSVDLALALFQFRVDKFTTGNFTGPLLLTVLDNSAHIEFRVEDRFQPSCSVKVGALVLKSFANPRYYMDDAMAAGFMLEKEYILSYFQESFIGDMMQEKMVAEYWLKYFFCRVD